jgi:signal transduction histidine kinase
VNTTQVQSPSDGQQGVPKQSRYAWWRKLLGEARTRILLLYLVLMLMVAAASVPIFRLMVFANVRARVEEDLNEEVERFRSTYLEWNQTYNRSEADLLIFLESYLAVQLPEDDIFLIALIDNQIYKSIPANLPDDLKPGSLLANRWQYLSKPISGRRSVNNPDIGTVLYIAQPLVIQGNIWGTFVVVHTTAGEQQEALDGVKIFIRVAFGVVMISFLIAWFATAQVLAPVKKLATTARLISETDLSQRLPVYGSGEMSELADTFNAMMNRLQDAFTSQRNFINDAGHELRTPVTIIQGHLELLSKDPDEQEETIALVMDELDRMGRLINDLIFLAKAERPDFLKLETIDIQAFTEEVFIKAQALAPRHWHLLVQGSGYIVGDRQRLTGAIINLANNAAQHTDETDQIELGSSISRHEVRLWVSDTGEGIAPKDQQRIFERFARAASTLYRSEGSGLGLAIVRAIAQAHGGRVELTSNLGMGSTFTLVLPLEPPKEKWSR